MKDARNVTVEITGMSCASCAKRVETALDNANGISESIVNFATKKATVTGSASAEEIYKIIEGLGYGVVKEETPAVSEVEIAQSEWKKFLISAILSIPVFTISMFMIHFRFSDLSQLILTTAVIFWPGIDFFKNAFKQIRRWSLAMDSLIALGSGAEIGRAHV